MQGRSLMTVWMPLDTVDSEVCVKTPRGHSAVTMDPWTSSTWRKPWNKYHTPNKVTKDKLKDLHKRRHTEVSVSTGLLEDKDTLEEVVGSPRPTKKYNPRALGLISGPCPFHFSRQVQLNKIRKEEDEECSPNPRKRAREATPFTTNEAPLEISSDEEKDQDKTSPTSPPTMKEDILQSMNTSQSPWYTLPQVTVQMMKTLAACLTL